MINRFHSGPYVFDGMTAFAVFLEKFPFMSMLQRYYRWLRVAKPLT